MTTPSLNELFFLMKETLKYIVVTIDLLGSDEERYLRTLGEKVEEFYGKFQQWRSQTATREEADMSERILKEIKLMAEIWRRIAAGDEGLLEQIKKMGEHVYNILKVLEPGLNRVREELPTAGEELNMSGRFEDIQFPQDLFSNKPLNFLPFTISEKDPSLQYQSYFDGCLVISEEANLTFLQTCISNITWKKDSIATWVTGRDLKGIQQDIWSNGLPLFLIGNVSAGSLWATFLPAANTPREQNQPSTLVYFKELYNVIYEELIPAAIRLLPGTSPMKAGNSNTDEAKRCKLLLSPADFQNFSHCLQQIINDARRRDQFPTNVTFHYVVKEFGQDYALSDNLLETLKATFDINKTIECLIHVATNFHKASKSLFWKSDFVHHLFHNTGTTYSSCGFNQVACGHGPLPPLIHLSNVVGDGIRFVKLYNTVFKRMPNYLLQYKQGFTDIQLFEHPFIAELLASQPSGVQSRIVGNPTLKFLLECLRDKLIFNILDQRMKDIFTHEFLHEARIEFVCSLKDASLDTYFSEYAGNGVIERLGSLSNTGDPIIALDRQAVCNFLSNEIATLSKPIKDVLDKFFIKQVPVTPDVIETVHVCESIISFILYGTNNYLPAFARLGLTGTVFRNLNRVSLAYATMRRKGESFLIDASQNTAGSIFSIRSKTSLKPIQVDAFTQDMTTVHQHLKISPHAAAAYVLFHFMQEVSNKGGRLPTVSRSFRSHDDPSTLFARPFVLSLQIPVDKVVMTVSKFINNLLFIDQKSFAQTFSVVETAIEILGDLYEDEDEVDEVEMHTLGRGLLTKALNVLFHSSLKKNIALQIDYVPCVDRFPHFQCIVPDFSEIVLQENPLIMHRELVQKSLQTTAYLMEVLDPYDNGFRALQSENLKMLHLIIKSGDLNATHALTLLACAIAFRLNIEKPKFLAFMKNRDIFYSTLFKHGLCVLVSERLYTPIDDPSFVCHLQTSISRTEKSLHTAINNLGGAGLYPF